MNHRSPDPAAGDAAVIYARLGWPVFPCHSPRPTGCSCHLDDCSSPAKHPRVERGVHAATTDETTLRGWWGRWPDANVAIATGAAAGIVVLDIDPGHGGDITLAATLGSTRRLPDTHMVHTGGGGRHLYFAHPGGTVTNRTNVLGPGVDVRGDGGYVLAPPSRHTSGGRYQPANHQRNLAPLPRWLHAILCPPQRPAAPAAASSRPGTAWAATAMTGQLATLAAAPQGSRNDALNRAAFRLGQIVATGALAEPDVTAQLLHTAQQLGLPEREAIRTIHSGLAAGQQHPRGPLTRPPMPSRAGVSLGLSR